MWWSPCSQSEAVAQEGTFPLAELYRDERVTSTVHGFGTVRLGESRSPLLVVDARLDHRPSLVRSLLRRSVLANVAFEALLERFDEHGIEGPGAQGTDARPLHRSKRTTSLTH